MLTQLLAKIQEGDRRALARAISLVENDHEEGLSLLNQIQPNAVPVIGITGPPGAGKSTLVDALIRKMIEDSKKVAVICVDPSSPFHLGALLGDRIRMSDWYDHPSVFIRSLATRGHMGGLSHKIIEISELLKVAGFDFIIIETVGVGQSEIEIAGLADVTVVVVVPEAGDEVQTMKAGLMEIADVFVVNKSDRPDADMFVKNLRMIVDHEKDIKVLKTVASRGEGVKELYSTIVEQLQHGRSKERKLWLMTEKVFELLQAERMKGVSKGDIHTKLEAVYSEPDFSLFKFAARISKDI